MTAKLTRKFILTLLFVLLLSIQISGETATGKTAADVAPASEASILIEELAVQEIASDDFWSTVTALEQLDKSGRGMYICSCCNIFKFG